MKCIYCEQEKKPSREHIISSSVLDLFPECYLTMDMVKKVIHQADPVIKDVCGECNSKIAYIDSYAKEFISEYFLEKYSYKARPTFKYNYTLLQKVLLKYAYNDLRSHKDDTTFFDQEIRNFILEENENIPKDNVIIMAGIAVNRTPAPDFMFGNLKLQMIQQPMFFDETLVENIDYHNWSFKLREHPKRLTIPELRMSYVFRFNSGQFLLLCFDKNIADLEQQKIVLDCSYPYVVLDENKGEAELPLCTSYLNYHHPGMVCLSWDPAFELSYMAQGANDNNEALKEIQRKFDKYEERLAEEHRRVKF